MVECNCRDKQFWKLFIFFDTVLIKLLCCSCHVFYSCIYAKIEYVSVRTYILQKIEYVGLRYVSSSLIDGFIH